MKVNDNQERKTGELIWPGLNEPLYSYRSAAEKLWGAYRKKNNGNLLSLSKFKSVPLLDDNECWYIDEANAAGLGLIKTDKASLRRKYFDKHNSQCLRQIKSYLFTLVSHNKAFYWLSPYYRIIEPGKPLTDQAPTPFVDENEWARVDRNTLWEALFVDRLCKSSKNSGLLPKKYHQHIQQFKVFFPASKVNGLAQGILRGDNNLEEGQGSDQSKEGEQSVTAAPTIEKGRKTRRRGKGKEGQDIEKAIEKLGLDASADSIAKWICENIDEYKKKIALEHGKNPHRKVFVISTGGWERFKKRVSEAKKEPQKEKRTH